MILGCDDITLTLVEESVCDSNYIYAIEVDCSVPAAFYDYELKLLGVTVETGKISVR